MGGVSGLDAWAGMFEKEERLGSGISRNEAGTLRLLMIAF